MDSGSRIRKLREEKFLRPREIERLSRAIVETTGNPDYYVSHATLADIEAGAVPSIYKLFSLSSFLGISYEDLLKFFRVNPRDTARFASPVDPAKTALVTIDIRGDAGHPFRLARTCEAIHSETDLLPVNPKKWHPLPLSMFKLDTERYRYAVIGSGDDTMRDLIPPGSLVEVDTQQADPERFGWRSLRDRPIYLVWRANGYTCCWCQKDRGELVLIPHPSSEQTVCRLKTPRDASVIGRVVAAWMSFAEPQSQDRLRLLM